MKTPALLVLFALALGLGVLFTLHRGGKGKADDGSTLIVYCAAGLKQPVDAIASAYRTELGTAIQLQYGGTGTLLSQIAVAKRGDLFIAADEASMKTALEKKLVREVVPLVRQYPVVAVAAGNPKGLASFDDLLRGDVRVALGNPEAASIGKATRRGAGDRWDALAANVTVMKPTVTEIAADLKIGSVDAAIVWNSTVPQFSGLEALRLPEFDAQSDIVSVGVLAASENPSAALRFARYLAAPEKGGDIFAKGGFDTIPGDAWAERPDLILYSGGVNRPAVEKILTAFTEREGITVTTVFNGCGILCSAMQAMEDASNPKFPDAYFACDLCFVPPVAAHFPEAFLLTETDIGIVTRKDSSHNIRNLADLAREGIKVGLCNQQQSTLGFMTQGILRATGLEESIRKNVVVEVPTADFLINQMRAGALDAAIVYRVNALLQSEHLNFIPIDHEGAKAVQPFAVRVDSPRAQLAKRLEAHFRANRNAFEDAGFHWRGEEEAVQSANIELPPWLKPAPTAK
jgi:molybdate transport system substrate-binding protein